MSVNGIPTFIINPGGSRMAFNITATGPVKANPGKVRKLFVQTAASAGNLTVNDSATVGAAAITNQIDNIPFGSLTQGAVITLDAPCANGITFSGAWPTGLVLAASYD